MAYAQSLSCRVIQKSMIPKYGIRSHRDLLVMKVCKEKFNISCIKNSSTIADFIKKQESVVHFGMVLESIL